MDINKIKNNLNKIDILAVVGPTATGKTHLAIELAKKLGGEVINADSMQVYKELNIGTAKPKKNELGEISYHLINIINKDQEFNLSEYVKLAKEKIIEIKSRNKLPILTGGTGLYVDSVINNVNLDIVPQDLDLRQKLSKQYDDLGEEYIRQKLFEIDKNSALKIQKNNKKRLIRALEINYLTSKTLDQVFLETKKDKNFYKTIWIGLNYKDRNLLYNKINSRVDDMINLGLVDEARSLLKNKLSTSSLQAIGYKEFYKYFENQENLGDTIEKIKRNTRKYAKRQITWFGKNNKINWFNIDEYENFEKLIISCLKLLEKNIV